MLPTGCAEAWLSPRATISKLVANRPATPAEGSPPFEYLVGRLLASFNLPLGVLRYIELMDPP
jgi:hypothetical protein